jgi:dGTPase
VFVNHEGDLFRTRLTHSIEVAQIARSIARNLMLNEDLVESIALAHDLGHTPFGHSGQDALNECMREYGGFEHNLQSLRVVDLLEQRYGAFDGLNLCFETREGILKHCSRANAQTLGDLGERFLVKRQPSLEAQLANLADEIAYNNHDVDDGLRSGLITLEDLVKVPVFLRHLEEVRREFPELQDRRLIHETIRRMINTFVTDLTTESLQRIAEYAPTDIEAVRSGPPLISFSPEVKSLQQELQAFLRANLYKHFRVQRMANKARRIVRELFTAFLQEPQLLPPEYQLRAKEDAPRAIADYVAGMTDRYAIKEYRRIFAVDVS